MAAYWHARCLARNVIVDSACSAATGEEIRQNALRSSGHLRLDRSTVCLCRPGTHGRMVITIIFCDLHRHSWHCSGLHRQSTKIVIVGASMTRHARPDRGSTSWSECLFAIALSAGHRDLAGFHAWKKAPLAVMARSQCELILRIFGGTNYKVVLLRPNMADYLHCHAASVMPVAFALL